MPLRFRGLQGESDVIFLPFLSLFGLQWSLDSVAPKKSDLIEISGITHTRVYALQAGSIRHVCSDDSTRTVEF